MFGRVARTPIANTFSELVEMDIVDYGDYAAFLHIRANFSRFRAAIFTGAKKKGEQTAEMARVEAISNCLAASGAPVIIVADKDSRSPCGGFSGFLRSS